jgi:hypothetical protein
MKAVTLNEIKMLKSLQQQLIGSFSAKKSVSEREIKELKRKIAGIDAQTEKLYENRLEGVISEDGFSSMVKSLEAGRREAETRLSTLERTDEERQAKLEDISRWVRLIKEKSSVKETDVDVDFINCLIDKIEVGEKVEVNGTQEQSIQIYYKYVGLLK